jgi:hypothetical protein
MQSAEAADVFMSGAKVKMIGVAEDDLRAEFFEQVLRDGFHRPDGADRHEDWRFHLPVRKLKASGAGEAVSGVEGEGERH